MKAIFLLFAILILASPLQAATKEELARIEKDLAAKREQDNALKKMLDKTEDELGELRQRLVRATQENSRSEETLRDLQTKLETLQDKEEQQRKALHEQQQNMGFIVSALLRMSRTPPEILLIRPEKPVDNIRTALLLRHAVPIYAEEAQRISSNLDALEATRLDIAQKQESIQTAQKDFSARQDELNALLDERQAWLKATESQRGDLQKQIQELSREAQNVQDLVTKVVASPLNIPEKAKKAGRLVFNAPAKGRILYGYGDFDDVGSRSQGLSLRVRAGDMIVAPADGRIVFAGPFKGYGNILIIRHGDDYHSFLAGFGRLDAAVGQVVNAGEPLGRSSIEKGSQVQVYYELRHNGAPIDPMKHLNVTNLAQREKTGTPAP